MAQIAVRLPALSPSATRPRIGGRTQWGLQAARAPIWTLGWLPVLTLVTSISLFIVSASLPAFNTEVGWAEPVFWLGLLAYFVPCMIRLAMPQASRAERIGIVVLIGMSLYLVKTFLYSGYIFNFPDETIHVRTANDMLATGRLFVVNPFLPVTSFYSGIITSTVAWIQLTGMSLQTCGIIVVALARLVTMLSLFSLYERVSGSARLAGIAAAFYASNPHFLLGNAMFAYESLGLPMIVFVMQAIVSRVYWRKTDHVGGLIVVALGIFTTIVTHHLSTVFMILILAGWAAVAVTQKVRSRGTVVFAVVLAIVGFVAWAVFVAPVVIPYLTVPVINGANQLVQMLSGTRPPRQLFVSDAVEQIPLIVKVSGFASVILVVVMAMPAIIPTWLQFRRQSFGLLAILLTLAYPAAQMARFTPFGVTVTYRSMIYLYIGLSFVVAVGARTWLLAFDDLAPRTGAWKRIGGRVVYLTLFLTLFFGTLITGFASWKLPGPFQKDVLTRRIDVFNIQTALWAHDHLPPNQRFGAEYDGQHVMGSFGDQRPINVHADNVWLEESVYYAPQFGYAERQTMTNANVQYLMIDRRTGNQLVIPASTLIALDPHLLAAPTKLDSQPGASRVFDGGEILIYDIRAVKP